MKYIKIALIMAGLVSTIYGQSQKLADPDCIKNFVQLFSSQEYMDNNFSILPQLASDICLPNLKAIQNLFKPTICTYQSLNILNTLSKYNQTEVNQKLQSFATDYCSSQQDIALEKLQFINSLNSYDNSNSEKYLENCQSQLELVQNKWFDPIIPVPSIPIGDMCKSFQQLFNILKTQNGNLKYDDAVIYSYTLVHETLVNFIEENLISECIDQIVLDDFAGYCQDIQSQGKLDFTLMKHDWNLETCKKSGEKMIEKCNQIEANNLGNLDGNNINEQCYPCSMIISLIFHEYEKVIDAQKTAIFKELSLKTAEILKQARYALELNDGNTNFSSKQTETKQVQQPE